MADKFEFELVSPEKLLASVSAEMVVVPGAEGDFGVLAGHSPMISGVRPGVIAIYEGDKIVDRIFVAGGFAEVTAERCTVLAEQAQKVSEIDAAAAEKAVKDLSEDVADAKSDAERATAEAKLAVALAKVEALSGTVH
jgi:F-type H+-transporting ATPase subunit epsilon